MSYLHLVWCHCDDIYGPNYPQHLLYEVWERADGSWDYCTRMDLTQTAMRGMHTNSIQRWCGCSYLSNNAYWEAQ
jgi:hypothetical protein